MRIAIAADRAGSAELALHIVEVWLATPFEGGGHARRIEKLDTPEAR